MKGKKDVAINKSKAETFFMANEFYEKNPATDNYQSSIMVEHFLFISARLIAVSLTAIREDALQISSVLRMFL